MVLNDSFRLRVETRSKIGVAGAAMSGAAKSGVASVIFVYK